eukprot:6939624-Prymnesium_polylepis.1
MNESDTRGAQQCATATSQTSEWPLPALLCGPTGSFHGLAVHTAGMLALLAGGHGDERESVPYHVLCQDDHAELARAAVGMEAVSTDD